MKNRLLLSFISLVIWDGLSQSKPLELPKSYIAYHTTTPVNIDGKGTEDSWKNSEWSDNFIDIEGEKTPTYRTRMKMLWDNTYLYFYAELEEPHIWGNITQRDAVIFHNNDFEIFIDPDGDTHNYMEFEMNALNTVWDLLLTKPYRNGTNVINNWDINGLKTAVHIEGTLNNPNDIDKKWSVEIAIPWKVLLEPTRERNIPKDKNWRINFSRVNWDFEVVDGVYHRKKDPKTGKRLPEYNWVWSPQGVINMHEPEHWGFVKFSSKTVGSKDKFTYGVDEKLKLKLYEFYTSYRTKFKDAASWKNAAFKKSLSIDGDTIKVSAEFTSVDYFISVKSPYTHKSLSISSDGKYRTK